MHATRARFAWFGLMVVLSGAPVLAQQKSPASDPARVAAAKEMFAASGQDAQFDIVITTMTQGLGRMFKQQQPAHARTIDEAIATMAAKFRARKAEVIEMIAPLYAEKFSAEELKYIADFYRTPIGRKLVAAQPELTQKSMLMGMQWGQRIGQEVEQELRRELKGRGVPI